MAVSLITIWPYIAKKCHYYSAICWNSIYLKLGYTASISDLSTDPLSVKISFNCAQSAGNHVKIAKMGSSETTRATTPLMNNDFLDWLAGLIDGDGSFNVSKAGYSSCEIVLHEKEIQALYKISAVFGGSVSPRVGSRSGRWRLHNILGMINLMEALNGRIQNPDRLKQFSKVINALNNNKKIPCNIFLVPSKAITLNHAWISGFFDAEGIINSNSSTHQLSFSISQKNRFLLDIISNTFAVGKVYEDKGFNGYKYYASSLEDLAIILKYFNRFKSLISTKQAELITLRRLMLFKERGYHKLATDHPKYQEFINLSMNLQNRK